MEIYGWKFFHTVSHKQLNRFFKYFVSVHVSAPYSRTDSTVARNNLTFNFLDSFELHTFLSLWHALHASTFLTVMSFSVLCVHAPRYLKFSTIFSVLPSLTFTGTGVSWLNTCNSVSIWFLLQNIPTLPASRSNLLSTSCACCIYLYYITSSSFFSL